MGSEPPPRTRAPTITSAPAPPQLKFTGSWLDVMPGAVRIESGKVQGEGERAYEPRGAALELFKSKRREVVLSGPAGTGKSRAALEKLNLVCMQRPVRAAIVRKVRSSITQSAMVTLESKVLPQPSAVRWHDTDQEYRYPNGARIVVGGLDDPAKLGSTEFDLVYVQEATELEAEDWGMLLRGLRNNVLSYQQLLADCNPSYPDHWLKVRCESGQTQYLESSHEDNPLLYDSGDWTEFGKEYIRTLDSLKGFQKQRLRYGIWCSAEGMYFQEWIPEVHVVEPFDVPKDWPRWLSVDYGYAVPFCVLWFTRDPDTRKIYVYREVYASGLRDEQQAEVILEHTGEEKVALRVLDPSMFNSRAEQNRPSIAAVYANAGLTGLYPAMNNRKQGWAVMRRALAHDEHPARFQVMRGRAPNLCREIPSLVHDPLDPEDVADIVGGRKIDDHAADACRYGLVAEAQPPGPKWGRVRWG